MSLYSSKSAFYRKTRRGGVIKQVNEVYLHSDFQFGYLHGNKLSKEQFSSIQRNSVIGQLVVVDTNILLHHMDILEETSTSSPILQSLIIPQTALSELRNLNLSIYKRALALFKDETRQIIFHPNICGSDTRVPR